MTVPTPLPEPSQSPNWAAQLNAAITDRYEDAKQAAAEVADTINTGRLSETELAATFLPKTDTGATGLAVLAAALPADAREALDITIDTSVGTRVMVGGVMIYGDTGWRNINTGDNILSGELHLRRVGAQVSLYLVAVVAEYWSANLFDTSQIPDGFRISGANRTTQAIGETNRATAEHHVAIWSAGSGRYMRTLTSSAFHTDGPADNLQGVLTWITDDPWPTTLPGTPA